MIKEKKIKKRIIFFSHKLFNRVITWRRKRKKRGRRRERKARRGRQKEMKEMNNVLILKKKNTLTNS